jgi:hypothetical protein
VGVRTVNRSGVIVTHNTFPGHHFHQPVFFTHGCFNAFNCSNRFFFGPTFGFGFGFGTGFGFGAVAPYYPYYPYPYYPDSYSAAPYYPSDYYSMNAPQPSNTENSNDVYIAQSLQKLADEVEDLKNQQNRQASAAESSAPARTDSTAPVTFVFHDGRRIVARNYAVAGTTLWIFSENAARKYLLADLDRAATEQVNAANGIELHLPEPAPQH